MNDHYPLNVETGCVVDTFPGPLTRRAALEVMAEEDGFGVGTEAVARAARAYGGFGHLVLICYGIEVTDE